MSRRDADLMVALCTPDVVWEPLSTQIAERAPYHGAHGLRAYLADLDRDWEEFNISLSEVHESAHHVVAMCRVYARAAGFVADSPVAVVMRLRDERTCWLKTYRDRVEALAVAGVS